MNTISFARQDSLLGHAEDVFRLAAQASAAGTSGVPAPTHDTPGFLTAQTAIATSPLTPTVTEFLNGAVSEYVLGGTPTGMTPFTVNGTQLSYHDDSNGTVGHAWVTAENQVLITFAGTTGGENALIDPLLTVGGLASDIEVLLGHVSAGQTAALGFAQQVIAAANAKGYANSQIFTTGHSLGGIEASYVAQQTGIGGIAFEATGIPTSTTGAGNGSNFVSVVTAGDPVGNFSTDINVEQPFAPAYVPTSQGGGSYAHYGTVVQIGSAADNASLHQAALDISNLATAVKGVAEATVLIADFHAGEKALYTDLSVTPTGNLLSQIPPSVGVAHGPILPLGQATIGQVQAYVSSNPTLGA